MVRHYRIGATKTEARPRAVRRTVWTFATIATVALAVWAGLIVRDRWFNPHRPHTDVSEALTFDGALIGNLNTAQFARCADSGGNSISITGHVGPTQVILTIVIPPDIDHSAPTAQQLSVTSATLYVPQTPAPVGQILLQLIARKTDPAGTITATAGLRTGTMDIWFALPGPPGDPPVRATHVVGQWRCA